MKMFIVVGILFLGSGAFAQHEFQTWLKTGVEGGIVKKLDWSFELNSRFGSSGLETFFPQAGIEYKVKRWFRPSIEYRYILDKDRYGNYGAGHRINFNASFKKRVERLDLGLRLRYQYAFSRLGDAQEYDSDFDQAIRTKLSASYDFDNCMFSPLLSGELFYDPSYGPKGPGFKKIRLAIGTSLELKGPHKVSIKYQLDKKLNDFGANLRHVLGLSYSYKL